MRTTLASVVMAGVLFCCGCGGAQALATHTRAELTVRSDVTAPATVPTPPAPQPCNGHPRNAYGFVTDGGPQCGDQWCLFGPIPKQFACLVVLHPGLPDWIRAHNVYVSPIPRNGLENCIVSHESGGRWNPEPPGDGGQRYQIEYGTWVANGGSPSTWGHASPQEQDDVFLHIVSSDGYGPWTNYDGC